MQAVALWPEGQKNGEEGQGVKMPAQEGLVEDRSKPVQQFQTGFHWKNHVA